MPDTPLTEVELKRIEQYTSPGPDTVRALVAEIRLLRADLEQAAKDYAVAKKEAFRISDWPDPDWLKRVSERKRKNG